MTTTNNETVELHGWVLTQIPSRAFYDEQLHAQAVRLLGAFCFHARLDKEAWPGFEKMVDKIPHMSERTGYRALEELRDAKYIYRYLTMIAMRRPLTSSSPKKNTTSGSVGKIGLIQRAQMGGLSQVTEGVCHP